MLLNSSMLDLNPFDLLYHVEKRLIKFKQLFTHNFTTQILERT